MAENTSGAQHFTELDFDISGIPGQLEQLEQMIEQKGKDIQAIIDKNWKIKDILEVADGGTGAMGKELNEAIRQVEKLKQQMKEMLASDKLKTKYAEDVYRINEKAYSLSKQMNSKNSSATADERQKAKVIKDQTDELVKQLKTKKQFNSEDLEQINNLKEQLRIMENQAKTGAQTPKVQPVKDGQSYLEKAKNFMSYRSFGYAERAVKEGFTAVKDVESQMAEINRVMDLGTTSINTFKSSLFGLGKEYGREFENVAEISLRYAQAGYNAQDTLKMTQDSLLALNTAELDVENSTNSLIGILQQWGLEAKDLSEIIDVLNYTADNNAITTQDLVDGLLNASSVAKVANMSFRDTVGVLTAMKEASGRSGKEVGNAFKSILSYIQRAGSLNAFDSMGIEVYADKATGALLPMMNILENMSSKWKTMGQAQQDAFIANNAELYSEDVAMAVGATEDFSNAQDALAQSTDMANTAEVRNQAAQAAGIYRRNYYIALMENFEKAVQVSKESLDAEGYSVRENAVYMETMEAKLKTLVTSLKELAVQAADAGLMDIAKGAVTAASAITGVIKGTGGLTPVLFAVLGVLGLIKREKIAKEFVSIMDTVKLTGMSFIDYTKSITSAQGATQKLIATTKPLKSINLAGWIGIATTAISLITMAVSAYNSKIEENKQKNIENAKSTKEVSDSVNSLILEYETLIKQTDLTDEAKQRLKSIQDELIKTYGLEKEGVDLVNGSYDEQIKKLKELRFEKLEDAQRAGKIALSDADNAATMGNNPFENNAGELPGGSDTIQENIKNGKWKFGETLKIINGMVTVDIKEGSHAKDVVADLEALLKSLEDTMGESAYSSPKYKSLAKTLTEQQLLLDAQKKAQKNLAEIQVAMDSQNIVIDSTESYESYINSISTSTKYTLEQKQAMLDVARSVHSEYSPAIDDAASSTNEYYGTQQTSAQATEEQSKALKDYQSQISTLAGHIDTLNNGGVLTAEQILSLIELYPELASQVEQTADGFLIEVDALEVLRSAQVDSAIAMKSSQIGFSDTVIAEVKSRIGMYKDEILGIKTLAEAQAALDKVSSKTHNAQSMIDKFGNSMGLEARELYAAQAYQGAQATSVIEELIKQFETISGLMNEVGRGASTAGSKASKATQNLSDLTTEFDIMVGMGLLSTQEQIRYFEELLRTTKLTADNIQNVQSKLHNLYMTQIKDRLTAFKNASDERISDIEREYDVKIKNATDYYDNELNKIDEISRALKQQRDDADYNEKMEESQYTLDNYELDYSQRKTLVDSMNKLTLDRQRQQEDDALALTKQRLQDEKEAKLKALEQDKATAIQSEQDKQAAIEKLFDESNLNMIAAAGNFVPELYKKFLEYFTNPLKGDLKGLNALMEELAGKSQQIKGYATSGKVVGGGSGGGSNGSTGGNSGGLGIGDRVRVNGSLYSTSAGAGQGMTLKDYVGKITLTAPTAPMPYHIDGKGWVKANGVVKAKTGGETLADGMAYLHKNEFIANSEITRGLKMVIDPEIIAGLRQLSQMQKNISSYVNNYNSSSTTGASVAYNFNAPLHQVQQQNVDSETNARFLANKVTNQIMADLNNLPRR